MREVLFRGKRTDNGELVYGSLIQRNIWGHIFPVIRAEDIGYGNFKEWEVIPETVGQYTGLDDKNGVKIFEGDILDKQFYWGWYVKFEEGAFRKVPLNLVQRINWEHRVATQYDSKDWEVIGNIHDNAELLEEAE